MSLGSGFRFLTALGGHIKLHCAVEVEVGDLRAVKQDDVLGSIQGGVFDPFFKVMDLHALFKGGVHCTPREMRGGCVAPQGQDNTRRN